MKAIWIILGILAWLLKPGQNSHRKLVNKDNDPENSKFTWEEYKLYAEFYKFFLDFGLKANIFFYGITGAILTILYSQNSSLLEPSQNIAGRIPPPVLKVVLITPFLIGIVLCGAFIAGAVLWLLLVRQIKGSLKAGEPSVKLKPYFNYLTGLLILFGVIFGFVSYSLCQIMKWHGIW